MNITPLQAIERILASGEDAWESIVTLANSSESDITARRWLIGDLGLLVQKEYGKNRLNDFATKANLARSTVSQYRNLSSFYPSEVRQEFETLSYSHFRCAMRLKEKAFSFLEDCSANSYTVEQAQIEVTKILGKPLPPLKLLDAQGCIQSVDLANGLLVVALAPGVDGLQLQGLVNQTVNVKLFETSED